MSGAAHKHCSPHCNAPHAVHTLYPTGPDARGASCVTREIERRREEEGGAKEGGCFSVAGEKKREVKDYTCVCVCSFGVEKESKNWRERFYFYSNGFALPINKSAQRDRWTYIVIIIIITIIIFVDAVQFLLLSSPL